MSLELLKFEAEWCSPCDQQSSLLESFDRVPVRPIDIDQNQQLANEYGVRSIPTMILLDGDEVVEMWTGVTQPHVIEEAINSV